MVDVEQLIANYREWLGVKYLHQGRTRHGADCLGFIAAGAAELGSKVFLEHLPINYARNPQSLLLDRLEVLTREIVLQPGALITIQWPLHKYASHAAIFTGSSIIHSNQLGGRKVVEHGYSGQWVTRTHSIWALPMVTYQ